MSGVKAAANPLSFLFQERVLRLGDREFKFRELSVAENDACIDAARNEDGTINGRINMRMMISKSAVDPKISMDDLAAVPNRVYLQLAEFVNDINSIDDALEDVEEGEEGDAEGKG